MKRKLVIITFLLAFLAIFASPDLFAQKKKDAARDITKVRAEQQANKKAIKETSQKITANTRETRRRLAQLQTLSAEVEAKTREIGAMRLSIDSLDGDIRGINDSITVLENRLNLMRRNYGQQLKEVQRSRGAMNTLSFIFSAESFGKAWQRVRYLKQMDRWRGMKAREIHAAADSLGNRRQQLDSLKARRQGVMVALDSSQKQLEEKRADTDRLVATLKTEGSSLKAVLKERESKQRALDRELDKLIAEEQRREEARRREEAKKAEAERKAREKAGMGNAGKQKEQPAKKTEAKKKTEAPTSTAAADRALTGSFESNKGRLLFPVSGRYRIVRGFGRQKHPELEHVETDNSGIDIEALGGGTARAVFDGRVSEIFRQPGYNTIVMVRHGNFLTIYANLENISVKKGETIKAGQTIGTIFADPEEDGRLILHFELRKERTKLNPMEWVK
ncbi:MAG: peptidoglycan DD-metalloendopeptidase family protein [Roseburia sp.]|nr:peptidoglycan DD-metalloendopeptidase family protein [Roseburia sp.]